MEQKILDLLVDKNEISWKSMLFELVEAENMDPWNVNISKLTQLYIERLKQYKEMDLKISGKVILAASILLRVKSKRLVGEDMGEFDTLHLSERVTE